MLATSYGLNSTRLDRMGPRGYTSTSLLPIRQRMGVVRTGATAQTSPAPVSLAPRSGTGASGAAGATGADTNDVPSPGADDSPF